MVGPVFTDFDVADLRQQNTAGLVHRARQRIPNRVRQPNGEYLESPTWGDPVCCLVKDMNWVQAQVAAVQGIKATGTMKVELRQPIPASSIWEVRTDCDVFAVEVTGDLVRIGRTMRLVAVKDIALNR